MNKLFISGLVLFFGMNLVFSQNVRFGIKAGGNLATLTGVSDFEYKFGPHFGAVANIPISFDISVQPELIYSSQGYKRNYNGVRETGKIDYFTIPLLVDIRVSEGFSLQGGPQIGINIRKEREVEGGIGENTSLFINDVDVSAAIGLQYFFDESFFMQGRYAFGLTEVVNNLGQKNSVISFSLGFFIDSSKDQNDDDDTMN